ncbi:MAG: hypothetical protein HRT64_08910 [Erythrobacter sp.]|nr:hypothetical protein [Erythrobacter sp.]
MSDTNNAQVKRSPLAIAMLAAWVNVDPEKLPDEYREAYLNQWTMDAWERVGKAAQAEAAREIEALRAERDGLREHAIAMSASITRPDRHSLMLIAARSFIKSDVGRQALQGDDR